ncbi:ATP-dependent RecD-like DNA helicase, partial [Acinetobacter sp. RIT592]
KSQGSEFKMVILPMVHQYQRMLQRNLLYTAVTRSKELLILLGEEQAYLTCAKNESAVRLTTLKKRIEDNEMTLNLRTKLAAYEDSLTGDDPFEEGTYSAAIEQVSEPTKQIEDRKEATDQAQEVSLFAIEEEKNEVKEAETPKLPDNYILTTEAVEQQWIDPMIGMENIRP